VNGEREKAHTSGEVCAFYIGDINLSLMPVYPDEYDLYLFS
jgi:hypothetical protein